MVYFCGVVQYVYYNSFEILSMEPKNNRLIIPLIFLAVFFFVGYFLFHNLKNIPQEASSLRSGVDGNSLSVDPNAVDQAVLDAAILAAGEDADEVTVRTNSGTMKTVPVPKKLFVMGGVGPAPVYYDDIWIHDALPLTSWSQLLPIGNSWYQREMYNSALYFKNAIWVDECTKTTW